MNKIKLKSLLSKEWFQALIIMIFYSVGIVSHYFPLTLNWMKILTPFVLLIVGVLVMIPYFKSMGKDFLLWFGITYILTFTLEVVGVATAKVFGAYTYGAGLGFHIASVPPIIGFNWVIIIFGLYLFISRFIKQRLVLAGLTGILAVAFDWVMEPVAIKLDYWSWQGIEIPLQNYVAWFVIAFLFSLSLSFIKIEKGRYLASWYVLIQLVFFVCLRFV